MAFTTLLQSSDIIAMIVAGLDAGTDPWVDKLSMRVDSDKDSERYVWLGTAPSMREWIGGRQPKTLSQTDFRVANKDFETTLEIPVDWIRRDKTGLIRMRIAQLVEAANLHNAELLSTLINAADATPCYDGQYFFDADHQEGDSPVQSNKVSVDIGTPTAPTAAEMEGAILTLVQQLLTLKDDHGRPTNASAKHFTIMIPVGFMKATATALGATVIVDGGQARSNNIMAVGSIGGFTFDVVTNPRLTWTDKFAIFRTDSVLKPFVKQVEVDTEVSAIAEGSEEEFKNKRHLYGVNRTMNFGLNDWKGAAMAAFT